VLLLDEKLKPVGALAMTAPPIRPQIPYLTFAALSSFMTKTSGYS